MMSSFEEPPRKKQCTSYDLCVFCQETTKEPLVNIGHVNFKCSSYEKFLTSLHKRAPLGNLSFMSASKRLHNVSSVELKEKKATWHKKCYNSVTNRAHMNRDEKKFNKSCATQKITNLTNRKRGRPSLSKTLVTPLTTEPSSTLTRSQSQTDSIFTDKCFFCQMDTDEVLRPCSSANRGSQFTEIVNKSGNKIWKVHLGDVITSGDLLARDIMYHDLCYTRNWEKYIQRPQRKKSLSTESSFKATQQNNLKVLAAEVEFISIIQQRVDEGEFILMPDVHRLYIDIVQNHNIPDFDESKRLYLTGKLKENLDNVKITSSTGHPSTVHSSDAGAAVIRAAAADQKDTQANFKLLFQCGKIIRKAITLQNPWRFEGSLKDSIDVGIPQQLLSVIRWIIQGTATTKTESRKEGVSRACGLIGQHIIQEFKSDRQVHYQPKSSSSTFRFTSETPLGVGLSLHSHHAHRSRKHIDVLHHTGVGVSYQRVKEITSKIANAVQENMNKFDGIYVPPGLVKNLPIRCSADNIDAKVDTVDGRNTFHGTALAVYQRVPRNTSECETVVEPLQLHGTSSTKLQNIPSTVTEMSECAITGSPKPNRSPRYEHFQLGQYQDKVVDATQQDFAWLLSRYSQRHHEVASRGIPVWSAYNSQVNIPDEEDRPNLDQDHTMPIIKAPAHEWITLVTVLEKLSHLNRVVCSENTSKLLVTFDMDLYKRALKLEYLNDQYAEKWILCPGGFHTVLCALRCLGRTVEHSGLDEAWSQDMYSSVTVNQILDGKHHNRAVEAHELTLEALFDLWFSEFEKERPTVVEALSLCMDNLIEANKKGEDVKEAHQQLLMEIEHLNLEKQLSDFDKSRSKFPMYQWARMYMRQVLALLNFTRSQKQPDLYLYLASLENLCVYFFSYNRLDYAQNTPEYIARLQNIKDSDPTTWNRLQAGEFALQKKDVPFTSVALDQGQEFLNKVLKGDGGLQGITNKPTTLLKYCLSAPVLARLAMESEEMIGMSKENSTKHHHLTAAKFTQREQMVNKLLVALKDCNPFADKSPSLYNLMTKQVVPKNIEKDILDMEVRGQQALNSFVEQRICGSTNLWDRMTKLKYLNWDDMCKTLKVKGTSGQVELKATNTLFARLLMIAKSSRQIDLQDVISNYEFTTTNSTLMTTNGLLITSDSKSKLIHELEGLATDGEANSEETPDSHLNTVLVVDGMSVVNEVMSAKSPKTCSDFGDSFIKTIESRCKHYESCHVIFDNYVRQNSIKDIIRRRKLGLKSLSKSYMVVDQTPIHDPKQFLANNKTKDSLTLYLADKLMQLNIPVVTVTRQDVKSNTEGVQPKTGVSTQEEADTLMILHATELGAAKKHVHIMTQDTDVMVLSLRRFEMLGEKTAMIMGTGDKRRKIPLKQIYDSLGPTKAAALPGFHCITGCDTCGHIRNIGKKTAFKALSEATHDELTALAQLGTEVMPSADVVSGCEQFLCRLMSTKNDLSRNAGELRWKRFKSQPSGIYKIPPTSGAWYQHILRAHMQAFIWNQDLVEDPVVPDPFKLGWSRSTDDIPTPILSAVSIAPESVVELVTCGCGISKCSRRCTCRQNNLTCTESCKCGADEECLNTGFSDQQLEENPGDDADDN